MTAKHFDEGKVPLDRLPFLALCHVARAIQHGEKKYGRDNWVGGMEWRKLGGSALRHLFAWFMGEDKDPESGLPHLAHATANLLFLLTYQLIGLGEDDRALGEPESEPEPEPFDFEETDECLTQQDATVPSAPSEDEHQF